MDDLGNAVVVVVIFCDIVSSLLHFFFGISHSTADMGGPDHGNIIFGISGSNGITQWDSGVFTEKTNGRALGQYRERRAPGIHCWRRNG